jgi:hypothetical protein
MFTDVLEGHVFSIIRTEEKTSEFIFTLMRYSCFSTLKMEAARCCDASVTIYQITQHQISEDNIPQSQS